MRTCILLMGVVMTGCAPVQEVGVNGVDEADCTGRRCVAGEQNQGRSLSGDVLGEGTFVDVMSVVLDGNKVSNVHVRHGGLFGMIGTAPVVSDSWKGATMTAKNPSGVYSLRVEGSYAADAEADGDKWIRTLDPSGQVTLYDVSVEDSAGNWQPLCKPDMYGSVMALPMPLWYSASGNQAVGQDPLGNVPPASNTKGFAWACMSGVSAKCVKWGYEPWIAPDPTDSYQLSRTHWACTRAARADYCGDGTSHTVDNTEVVVWDDVKPAQILTPDTPSLISIGGVVARGGVSRAALRTTTLPFEAGWSTNGAICLSHWRWSNLPTHLCAGPAPFDIISVDGEYKSECNDQAAAETQAQTLGQQVRIFNESNLNLGGTIVVNPIGAGLLTTKL